MKKLYFSFLNIIIIYVIFWVLNIVLNSLLLSSFCMIFLSNYKSGIEKIILEKMLSVFVTNNNKNKPIDWSFDILKNEKVEQTEEKKEVEVIIDEHQQNTISEPKNNMTPAEKIPEKEIPKKIEKTSEAETKKELKKNIPEVTQNVTQETQEIITPNDKKNDSTAVISPTDTKKEQPLPQNNNSQDNNPINKNSGETNSQNFSEKIAELVNIERKKLNLSPLIIDEKTNSAAQFRATELVKSFSHTRPNGKDYFTVFAEFNVTNITSGENIAWGQTSPEQVMTAWMNSSGHKANILGEKFQKIGVGVYINSGKYHWCQLFIG
ncbi:hypothetical protein FACS189465_2520 [Clostridia bacterium]|nr:hypothetical protein FACS189465_2520 [Clostridia bacterium]